MGTTILPFRESRTDLPQRTTTSSTVDSREAAFAAARAAESKKAKSTVVLDVRQVTLLADYFVFTGGDTQKQVKAIAEEVRTLLEELGRKDQSAEGLTDGRWVLLDYGDVIVHVLQDKERNYYKLEQFWNHALIVDQSEWSNNDEIRVQSNKDSK